MYHDLRSECYLRNVYLTNCLSINSLNTYSVNSLLSGKGYVWIMIVSDLYMCVHSKTMI